MKKQKKQEKDAYIPFPKFSVKYKSLNQTTIDEMHDLREGTCEVCGRYMEQIKICFLDGFYSRKIACADCEDFFKEEKRENK